MSQLLLCNLPCQGALLTEDRLYRFRLWRRWGDGPMVAFLGLNPSTADETRNDPTVRRCIRYAMDWGKAGMFMLNLYGWRSTDPAPLWDGSVVDPVGPGHDQHLLDVGRQVDFVVCAWGAFRKAQARGRQVLDMYAAAGVQIRILQLTQQGFPAHPLYLPADLKPRPWSQ